VVSDAQVLEDRTCRLFILCVTLIDDFALLQNGIAVSDLQRERNILFD